MITYKFALINCIAIVLVYCYIF